MKLTKVQINNYRNLSGISVSFSDDCNFVVGENNLGKSNLLSLLNTLFSFSSFRFEDFKDPEKPIEVFLQIKLADIEIGHFQDLFDTDDFSKINIIAKQINTDDSIEFYHQETNTFISSSVVRCINYIHYDSLRNPVTEINFDKGKGVGRFLRNIISQYLEDNKITDKDFLKQEKIDELIQAVNKKISKIKAFKDFDISAMPDDDMESLLTKVIIFKDGKGGNLTKAGYGIQFLILISLSILEKIQKIKLQRKDRGIFEDETTGSKAISLVLGLDEPEIHLHPYMQRSLIKYLNDVINNKNAEFKQLVKELFDIDQFVGQIIIVTHSPNIILNDYKQIIRFYSEKGLPKIISGIQLSLGEQLQKHLYLHFPFIKEAFFSRCAIFVEGDSEFASFPYFGKTMSIEFDDLGICVIQAHGESIPQLIEIAGQFKIPAVGITDKNDGKNVLSSPNHFKTKLRDFEEEIISLIDEGKEDILREILCQFDPMREQRTMDIKALNKRAHNKYGVGASPFTQGLKLADIAPTDTTNLKAFYLTWYSRNKSYPLGKLIGEYFTIAEIPKIYQTVITEAKKLAQNV